MSNYLNSSLATFVLIAAMVFPAMAEDTLSVALQASKGGHYRQVESEELVAAQDIFASLLAIPERAPKQSMLRKLGLSLSEINVPERFVVLREERDNKRGRGFFALRAGGGSPLMLQMPHSFKDELTREIGLRLFIEGRATAALWNTVPRWYEHDGSRIDADMAHRGGTYFQVASEAWATAHPRGFVLQLHGFQKKKHFRSAGSDVDAVLSSGRVPTPEVFRMGQCLRQSLIPNLLVYPTEIRELGGTTNSIGQVLHMRGYQGFLHLEMSRALRERLVSDADARKQLLECLPR